MDRQRLHQHIATLALTLTLFTFPFRPLILNNLCIIVLAMNWAFDGQLRKKLRELGKKKMALLYAGLFAILLLSFAFSENKKHAAFVLEQNVYLLLMPAVLATSRLSSEHAKRALYGLVLGCLVGAIICLTYAFYRYHISHQTHYFFYHDLSKSILGLHAVYYSLYVAVCILFLVLELEEKWRHQRPLIRSLHIGLIVFFCGFIFLLSSKTIIVALIVLLNLLFIYFMLKKGNFTSRLFIVLSVNIAIAVGIFKIDYIKNRFMDSLDSNIEFIKKDTYSELTVFTGVTVRLTFWKFVVEVLNENERWLTGMTIGDGDTALQQKARDKGLYSGNAEMGWTDYTSYNAHNQFFQYLLLLGIPGLVYFLTVMTGIVVTAVRRKKILLLLSVILFAAFCVTESVLAVNKGIIFFSIVLPLLIYTGPKNALSSQIT